MPNIFFIPVELSERRPRLPGEQAGVRRSPTSDSPPRIYAPVLPGKAEDIALAPLRADPQDEDEITQAPPVASTLGPPSPTTSGPIDDTWAVRARPGVTRGFVPTGRLNCRDLIARGPMDRAVCEQQFEAAAARIGERRLTRAESVREDGFAEQAAANQAWSDYRRGNGDEPYPGLRSLMRNF